MEREIMDITVNNDDSGSEDMDLSDGDNDATLEDSLPVDSMKNLPDAVVQRIFMSLSPAALFRLTRVCRRFKHLLEDTKGVPPRSKAKFDSKHPEPAAHLVDSEAIWTHSRRLTYSFLPKPLLGFSEASMLRLVTQRTCCNCKQRFDPVKATDALNGGPGKYGIRTIWVFRLAACGGCIAQLTITDVELLQERSPLPAGALRRGLPYAFISKDLHIISEQNARNSSNLGISKILLRDDTQEIVADYEDAKGLGEGTLEEWLKGLDDRGKRCMADPLRWVRWEEALPLGTDLAVHLKELDPSSFAAQSAHQQVIPAGRAPTHPLPRPVQAATFSHENVSSQSAHNAALSAHEQAPARQPRGQQEVQMILRQRRADINRRCLQLQPPLTPEVLQYSKAYNAAVVISMPMTDALWEQLKPRIEQDRQQAERERERVEQDNYQKAQQLAYMRSAMPSSNNYGNTPALHKEEVDREWIRAREGPREKIKVFADEIIQRKWLRAPLDETSAPIFAAEVLAYTYDRYQQEQNESATAATATPLVLDDFRWLFDRKIRPLTEDHCHELFCCSGCYADREVRWFPFESLIQHYGAKHAPEFSHGNIVVHWQGAEWPEEPPFVIAEELITFLRPRSSANRRSRDRRDPREPSPPRRGYRDPNERYIAQEQLPSDYPVFPPVPESADSNIESLVNEEAHIAQIGYDAADVWNQLAGVSGLLDSIRVQTVLQLVKARYEHRFGTLMPMDLLTKTLATNPALEELKAAKDLGCRFCPPTMEETGMKYIPRLIAKPTHNLSGLLNHYILRHAKDHAAQHVPGVWSNLVDLPDIDQVQNLVRVSGMNDEKLALVAHAFPGVFPMPLPRIGRTIPEQPDSGLAKRILERFAGNHPPSRKKRKHHHKQTTSHKSAAEYDPHNPTLNTQATEDDVPIDLNMFDTDRQRPQSGTATERRAPAATSRETPAAIHDLRPGRLSGTHAATVTLSFDDDRPPSPYANRASAPLVNQPVPDITHIINTLNGLSAQRAESSPTFTPNVTQVTPFVPGPAAYSTPQPRPYESFTPVAATTMAQHHWPQQAYASSRYSAPPHQPAAPEPYADLLSALNHNNRAFQSVQQHNYEHYESARSSAPPVRYEQTPAYQPMPQYLQYHQSPPPPVDYTQQAGQPVHHVYGDPHAQQYVRGQSVQQAPPGMVPQEYRGNPQQGPAVYIDEYGRRYFPMN